MKVTIRTSTPNATKNLSKSFPTAVAVMTITIIAKKAYKKILPRYDKERIVKIFEMVFDTVTDFFLDFRAILSPNDVNTSC